MNPQIIIILAIVLITFLISLKSLKWAFYLFLFTVPLMHKELFSLYQWDFLPARFASIGLALGFGVQALLAVKRIGFKEVLSKVKNFAREDRPFQLLLALLIIRIISSLISGTTLQNYQFLIFFISMIVLYVVASYINRRDGTHKFFLNLIKIYMVVGFLATIFAYIQMYLRIEYDIKIGAIWPVENNIPRLGSSFWDVNHFGGFLITIIPLYFVYTFIASKWYFKLMNLFALGATASMLFFTQSRSSWLGFAIAMLIGIFLMIRKGFYKPILLFAAGAVLVGGVFLTYLDIKDLTIRQRVADFMHYRLDSTDTHLMLLDGAINIFYDKPVLGAGPGNFNAAFRETETSEDYFEREPNLKKQEVPPHSVWGEIISENGYLGFLIYLVMMVFVILSLVYISFRHEDKNTKLLSVGLFVSLLSILITGIFYSYNLEFYWVLFIICTLFIKNNIGIDWSFRNVFGWFASKKYAPLFILLPLSAIFILINIGGATLLEWDEAIYAKVAKNIVQSGNWLSLTWQDLNDDWFEKPPLYLWLTAATFKIFGFDEFSARIWSAVFGLSTITLTYFFSKRFYNRFTGLIAGLILLTSAHFLYYSRNSLLDVPVGFFIFATICLFYFAINSNKRSTLLYILAGLTLGLGVMTKAVVGLLPVPIILVYIASARIFYKDKLPVLGVGLIFLIGLLVAAPWHIYSYMAHGEDFIDTYFFKHMFDRGTEGLGHVRPIYWYTEVLQVSFRVWLLPLLLGLFLLPIMDKTAKRTNTLVFISAIFIFIFFSFPKDKLAWYIVPIYPYLAIISARFIDRLIVLVKSAVKENYLPDVFTLKLIVAGLFVFLTPFYVALIRDKVYFEDTNKDIVALIKIHNQSYPIEKYPKLELHYARIPETVAYFYSDHKPEAVSTEKMLDMIESAEPDQFHTFIISQTRFYQLKGLLSEEVAIPSDLRIRGSSGKYVLARSMSRVDLLDERYGDILVELRKLYMLEATPGVALTEFEEAKVTALETELLQIVDSLKMYGYDKEIPQELQ